MSVAEVGDPAVLVEEPVATAVGGGDYVHERLCGLGWVPVQTGVPIGVDPAGSVEEPVAVATGTGGDPGHFPRRLSAGVGPDLAESENTTGRAYKPVAVARRSGGDADHPLPVARRRPQVWGATVRDHGAGLVGNPAAGITGPGGPTDDPAKGGVARAQPSHLGVVVVRGS